MILHSPQFLFLSLSLSECVFCLWVNGCRQVREKRFLRERQRQLNKIWISVAWLVSARLWVLEHASSFKIWTSIRKLAFSFVFPFFFFPSQYILTLSSIGSFWNCASANEIIKNSSINLNIQISNVNLLENGLYHVHGGGGGTQTAHNNDLFK